MLRCVRCCRSGDSQEDIQSQCIDKQTIGCPAPVDVIPGKDIVMACRVEACGKQFAFPAHKIPSRTVPPEVACSWQPCGILVVNPTAAPVKEKAARGKGKA